VQASKKEEAQVMDESMVTDADIIADHVEETPQYLTESDLIDTPPAAPIERMRQRLTKKEVPHATAGGSTSDAADQDEATPSAASSSSPHKVCRAHAETLRQLHVQLAEKELEIAQNDPTNPVSQHAAVQKQIDRVRASNKHLLLESVALVQQRFQLLQVQKTKEVEITLANEAVVKLQAEVQQHQAKFNEVGRQHCTVIGCFLRLRLTFFALVNLCSPVVLS
jgi:hypothetical protein